jgi:Tfp pilus assembly protein PilO
MQSHRLISGATILLMVVLVVAGWFLVAQPQLAAASTANDTLTGVESQIAETQSSIVTLRSQQKDLPKLKEQLAALRTSIPESASASAYIDGLNALASTAGVTLTSISVSDAVAYTPPVAATTPAATTGSATPTPTPTPTASASTAPVAPVAPTGWTPTSDPTITAANFVAIPVSIGTEGNWDATLAFFQGLQSGTRLFLVAGFQTGHSGDNPNLVDATITGYIYVLLDPKADALAAADKKSAATATPTPTPTPTATTTSTATPNPSGSSTPTPTTSPTPTK